MRQEQNNNRATDKQQSPYWYGLTYTPSLEKRKIPSEVGEDEDNKNKQLPDSLTKNRDQR
jgi:hypothetical protein